MIETEIKESYFLKNSWNLYEKKWIRAELYLIQSIMLSLILFTLPMVYFVGNKIIFIIIILFIFTFIFLPKIHKKEKENPYVSLDGDALYIKGFFPIAKIFSEGIKNLFIKIFSTTHYYFKIPWKNITSLEYHKQKKLNLTKNHYIYISKEPYIILKYLDDGKENKKQIYYENIDNYSDLFIEIGKNCKNAQFNEEWNELLVNLKNVKVYKNKKLFKKIGIIIGWPVVIWMLIYVNSITCIIGNLHLIWGKKSIQYSGQKAEKFTQILPERLDGIYLGMTINELKNLQFYLLHKSKTFNLFKESKEEFKWFKTKINDKNGLFDGAVFAFGKNKRLVAIHVITSKGEQNSINYINKQKKFLQSIFRLLGNNFEKVFYRTYSIIWRTKDEAFIIRLTNIQNSKKENEIFIDSFSICSLKWLNTNSCCENYLGSSGKCEWKKLSNEYDKIYNRVMEIMKK